jgi:hypothetical protein
VLARWQELVGTGELLRSLDQRVGRLRDRVVSAVKGTPQQADRVAAAVAAALEALVLDHAESAAGSARAAWEDSEAGRALVARTDDVGRASRHLPGQAAAEVASWQAEVEELVRTEGGDRRTSARFLAYGVRGLGVALAVQALASRVPGDPGPGADPGADPRTVAGSASLGRTLLDAVFAEAAVDALVERAGMSLERRLTGLLDSERARLVALLDELDVAADAGERLREAARRIDDLRFEQARSGADPEA